MPHILQSCILLVVTSVRLPSRYSGSVPLGIFVGYLATPGSTHMRITLNYGEVVDHFFGSKEDVSQDLGPTNSLKNDQCNRTDWVLDSFGSLKYHKMNVLYFLKPCVGCFVNRQVYQCIPAGLTYPKGPWSSQHTPWPRSSASFVATASTWRATARGVVMGEGDLSLISGVYTPEFGRMDTKNDGPRKRLLYFICCYFGYLDIYIYIGCKSLCWG